MLYYLLNVSESKTFKYRGLLLKSIKEKMKKASMLLGVGIVLLMITGVLAQTEELSDNIQNFVKNLVKEKGIEESSIKSISKVDFNNLPEEINIENIDQTNLGVYEVDYGEEKPVFVITVSEEYLKEKAPIYYTRSLLHFGSEEKTDISGFLKTAAGVESDLDRGYVMIRDGSITGISTSLRISDESSSGQIEIIVYKNGEAIGFGNTMEIDSPESQKDYDIQSENTVNFEAGDTISVYVKASEGIVWEKVITMVEITSAN